MAADDGAVVVDDVGVDGVDGVAEGDVLVDGRESGDGRGERPGPDHGLGPGVLWTVSNAGPDENWTIRTSFSTLSTIRTI